jgi:ATP-dependent helicase HrpA
LQELILAQKQVRIDRSDWPLDSLSDHLKVRCCLIDRQGIILKASRNFTELARPAASRPPGELPADLPERWEKKALTGWDFAGLPERVPVKDRQGHLLGFAWPGLEETASGVINLRLFPDREEARARTRSGLAALYLRYFPQFKNLKKDFALGNENWALHEGVGGREEVNRDLRNFILEEIFSCRDGVIPDQATFAEQVAKVGKAGLLVLGRDLLAQVIAALRERRAVLDLLNRYEGLAPPGESDQRFASFRRHLEAVLPADFLRVFDGRRLRNCHRYLQALLVRIERAHADPGRDALRAEQVRIHEERLASVSGQQTFASDYARIVAEYREMIDEFRISVFAQELKTAFPVSPKRLDKKWQELKGLG